MKPSINAINIIKEYEGLRLTAYICPAGKWTIGYGSTRWIDDKPILPGQTISMDMAEKLLMHDVEIFAKRMPDLNINQNQFDALVSFCYNVGTWAFMNSTMHRKIKANPNDSTIRAEFMKWTKARKNGKLVELRGLIRRRRAEADLYEKK